MGRGFSLVLSMLHITNGDCAGDSLKAAGLPGDVVVSCDVLHDGPLPRPDGPPWRETQTQPDSHDEIVLWFEHDLFDQLLLIRLLAWFAERETTLERVKLICIGEFPDVVPFHGLGQLSPEQLATLFPPRQPVTEAQFALGARAWRAFSGRDPRQVELLLNRQRGYAPDPDSPLPFLSGALLRQLEEFPSVRNGLSRTEQRALESLAQGAGRADELFLAVTRTEERVFMGDLAFYDVIDRLAAGDTPLVSADPTGSNGRRSVHLTAAGRDVLAGREDAIALRGIDRWIGGVHLSGAESHWRWDTERRSLTRSADL